MRIDAACSVHTRMSAAIALTGASSFASRPLLFALLRRRAPQHPGHPAGAGRPA